MCDDYFEDDFEGDDGFMNEPSDEGLPGDDPLQDDTPDEAESDEHYRPDWENWMIIGPLSEDLAREKRERERIRREADNSGDDYWDNIEKP
jgi:hypothetical protein